MIGLGAAAGLFPLTMQSFLGLFGFLFMGKLGRSRLKRSASTEVTWSFLTVDGKKLPNFNVSATLAALPHSFARIMYAMTKII